MRSLVIAFVVLAVCVNGFAVTALAAACQHDMGQMLYSKTMVMDDNSEMPCPDHQDIQSSVDDCGDLCMCMHVCIYPTSFYVDANLFSGVVDLVTDRIHLFDVDGVSRVVEPPRYPPKVIFS